MSEAQEASSVNESPVPETGSGSSPAQASAVASEPDRRRAHRPNAARQGRAKKQQHPRTTVNRQPPVYPVEQHLSVHHGDTRDDPYHWLANRKDSRVRRLIENENAALEGFFAESQAFFSGGAAAGPTPPLRKQLFREMRRRWKEDDVSLPTLDRSYWYYVRQVKNAEYPLYCRRPYSKAAGVNVNFLNEMCALWRADPTAVMPAFDDEVVFLDLNLLEQERKLNFVEVGDMDISPSENELALTLDCSDGKEVFTLLVMPIQNVNYARWLERDSDAMHRAWAKELEQTQQSVYCPLTPASSLAASSPASSAGPSSRGRARKTTTTKTKRKGALPAQPSQHSMGSGEETKSGGAEGLDNVDSASAEETHTVSREQTPGFLFPAIPPPHHTIRVSVDIFELSGEVLWVSEAALMYIAVDEKLRRNQVIYHDLNIRSQSDASYIVYEESDEAFWVGSLCFSADDAYVLFCTSSTEVSEWFAVPVAGVPGNPPVTAGCVVSNGEPATTAELVRRRRAPSPMPPVLSTVDWESRACENRVLVDVPIAQEKLWRAELTNKVEVPAGGRGTAPVLQLSSRAECPCEYDLDHHKALLSPQEGPDSGAWILVGNAHSCTNFGIFILPDSVVAANTRSVAVSAGPNSTAATTTTEASAAADTPSSAVSTEEVAEGGLSPLRLSVLQAPPNSSTAALWQPLFAYDGDFKVEGVESFYHFLLIAVRSKGHPTTLFCPIQRVWKWWAEALATSHSCGVKGSESASVRPAPLRLRQDTFDLSNLLTVFPELRTSPASPASATGSCGDNSVVAPLDLSPTGSLRVTRLNAQHGDSIHPQVADGVPAELLSIDNIEATPLRYAVECYADCTSYYTPRWRMSVSHLLHPALQLECEYRPAHSLSVATSAVVTPDHGEGAETVATPIDSLDMGTLHVKLLREEIVNGLEPYHAEAYDGAVVWVPSDHFVNGIAVGSSSERHGPTEGTEELRSLLVPTREPSPPVRIPVTMCWRKDCYRLHARPMVIHVYGSYGDCEDPEFSTERLSLLDRGLAWAYAAVRGGGELGIPWRDAGRKLQRATTVNDFVSVASYLQATGLCRVGSLVACGGSAGGVAVCRAMMLAPQLFFAVVGSAPFVDCLASLLDDDMPLSVTEREEFGDPTTDAEAYQLIKTLSPTESVHELVQRVAQLRQSGAHERPLVPHVLLQTSWEDTRVGFWEPMKLTAALRATVYKPLQESVEQLTTTPQGSDHAVESGGAASKSWPHLFFCCDYEAGHAGSSGRYQQLREIAREYAFILCVLQRQGYLDQE